jgi:hypothetical protein
MENTTHETETPTAQTEKPVSKYSKKPRSEAQQKAFEKAKEVRAQKVAERKRQKEMEKNKTKVEKLKTKLQEIEPTTPEVEHEEVEPEEVESIIDKPKPPVKKRGRKPNPIPDAKKIVKYEDCGKHVKKLKSKVIVQDSDTDDSETDSEDEYSEKEQPVYILKTVRPTPERKRKKYQPIVSKEYVKTRVKKPRQPPLPHIDVDEGALEYLKTEEIRQKQRQEKLLGMIYR